MHILLGTAGGIFSGDFSSEELLESDEELPEDELEDSDELSEPDDEELPLELDEEALLAD